MEKVQEAGQTSLADPKNAFSQSPHCWKHAATVIANSLAEKYAALALVVTPT